MACLLGGAQELEADSRIELNPWLLRGVDVNVPESLVVQLVALHLVAGRLTFLPAWLREQRYRGKTIDTSEGSGKFRLRSQPSRSRDSYDYMRCFSNDMTAPDSKIGLI